MACMGAGLIKYWVQKGQEYDWKKAVRIVRYERGWIGESGGWRVRVGEGDLMDNKCMQADIGGDDIEGKQ